MDDLNAKIKEIMDATGLDEVTAAKIASPHVEPPRDQAPPSITTSIVAKAMTAPPTPNEPHEPPTAYSTRCPDCAGAGWYLLAVPFGHPDFGIAHPCRCKLVERSRHAEARRLAILDRLGDELGALADKRLDTYSTTHTNDDEERGVLREALAEACVYAEAPNSWLYFWGPCGTGKSHLAAGIARICAEGGMRVSYASVPALLRYLQGGIKDGSGDARMAALQVVDLLVLDDIGAEYHRGPGDWAETTLFELINQRYLYRRATVFTSNMGPAELEPRISSRIRGLSRVVFMDASDYRLRGAP